MSGLSPQQKRALYIGDAVHLTDEGHRLVAGVSLPALQQFMQKPGK